jgi:hypothetical protein
MRACREERQDGTQGRAAGGAASGGSQPPCRAPAPWRCASALAMNIWHAVCVNKLAIDGIKQHVRTAIGKSGLRRNCGGQLRHSETYMRVTDNPVALCMLPHSIKVFFLS